MFKIPEQSEEDKARFEEQRAQESCAEQIREDQHRRKWALECAATIFHGEGTQGDVFAMANQIYDYVYGKSRG